MITSLLGLQGHDVYLNSTVTARSRTPPSWIVSRSRFASELTSEEEEADGDDNEPLE